MYVAERCGGTGAGRALLEEAIRVARRMPGLRSVHLSVSVTQEAPRRLYSSAGFRPYGLEPQALGVGE
jgi:ribosomal protein S18 acetylase RimI-like enzyme